MASGSEAMGTGDDEAAKGWERSSAFFEKLWVDDSRSERPNGSGLLGGWDQVRRCGLKGLIAAESSGGRGLSYSAACGAFEGLGKVCRDNGLLFALGAHTWGCVAPIERFGSAQQRTEALQPLSEESAIGALCASEPDAGSDVFSLKSTATRDGDEFILSGTKSYATNAPLARWLLVLARTSDASVVNAFTMFLIDCHTPGLTIEGPHEKLGLRGAQIGTVKLADCRVSASSVLGPVGAGFAVFNYAMSLERPFILASAIGTMHYLIQAALDHLRRRQQFGAPLLKLESIRSEVVDMQVDYFMAKAMVADIARRRDEGLNPSLSQVAATKLRVSEAYVDCADRYFQLFGGAAFIQPNDVDVELRDALASRIYSGTSGVQRATIARHLSF